MATESSYKLHLAEIRLGRFKAAFNMKKSIELHSMNAVIGRNGAGKSTLVDALQWVDAAIRLDVLKACDRFKGVQNIINFGSGTRSRRFEIHLVWKCQQNPLVSAQYSIVIGEKKDLPYVQEEDLIVCENNNSYHVIETVRKHLRLASMGGRSEFSPFFYDQDLLLSTLMRRDVTGPIGALLRSLSDFWNNAIFLRLSPNAMAEPVSSMVGARDPILNETGSSLPNLLKGFDAEQRRQLMHLIKQMLPDFYEVEVSRPSAPQNTIHYSLVENVHTHGKKVGKKVSIPAWMLSEGTRRITALIAVLLNTPSPSLLCVEELENGLDPWSVVTVLKELDHWSENGVQVLFTTHSPWLLDHVRYDDIIKVERSEGDTVYNRFSDLESVRFYRDQVPPGAVYASGE